jgi:predicted nucleic acid-binding protein
LHRQVITHVGHTSEDILVNAKTFILFGLKHKDAIHLACAIKHKCDYLITTDKSFLNKNSQIADIEIVNPITFIFETEETK